jgi:hypothetical protein
MKVLARAISAEKARGLRYHPSSSAARRSTRTVARDRRGGVETQKTMPSATSGCRNLCIGVVECRPSSISRECGMQVCNNDRSSAHSGSTIRDVLRPAQPRSTVQSLEQVRPPATGGDKQKCPGKARPRGRTYVDAVPLGNPGFPPEPVCLARN